jgi:hypothetical protein
VSGNVPHKFYTSKAFDFCFLGQKFNKQCFLEHLNSSDIDKIYNDPSQEPDDTLAYNLKLHVSNKKFPLDFKSALYSIFNFLDNLVTLNPFDQKFKQQILDTLFTDSIHHTTKADITYINFCSESFKMKFFYLDKSPLFVSSPDLYKKIVVSEFLDDMLLNPYLYQPHEYQFATRILDSHDYRSIALDHLYEFFKLIRPQEFEETLERSEQTTKIFNKDYYLPKNNFYNWMKENRNDKDKSFDKDYVPATLWTPSPDNSLYYNVYLQIQDDIPNFKTNETTYFIMKKPLSFPLGYPESDFETKKKFFLTLCEGILYRDKFYKNPKAIEIKS